MQTKEHVANGRISSYIYSREENGGEDAVWKRTGTSGPPHTSTPAGPPQHFYAAVNKRGDSKEYQSIATHKTSLILKVNRQILFLT